VTFVKKKRDVVPWTLITSQIAHIRQGKTETENSAASSADDMKRSFTRLNEEAEKCISHSIPIAFALQQVVEQQLLPSSKPQPESRRKPIEGEK
jgi:hypothetical protein